MEKKVTTIPQNWDCYKTAAGVCLGQKCNFEVQNLEFHIITAIFGMAKSDEIIF